jgi:hypothetical protein
MTDELRAQVIKLLRKTADKYYGIAEAYGKLYHVDVSPEAFQTNWNWRGQHPIWDTAVKAREAVLARWEDWSGNYPSYDECCLQAADLLEEGSWEP